MRIEIILLVRATATHLVGPKSPLSVAAYLGSGCNGADQGPRIASCASGYWQAHRHRWCSRTYFGIRNRRGKEDFYREDSVHMHDPGQIPFFANEAAGALKHPPRQRIDAFLRTSRDKKSRVAQMAKLCSRPARRPSEWKLSHPCRENDSVLQGLTAAGKVSAARRGTGASACDEQRARY